MGSMRTARFSRPPIVKATPATPKGRMVSIVDRETDKLSPICSRAVGCRGPIQEFWNRLNDHWVYDSLPGKN
jgi:hypothetical protein